MKLRMYMYREAEAYVLQIHSPHSHSTKAQSIQRWELHLNERILDIKLKKKDNFSFVVNKTFDDTPTIFAGI